MKWSENSVSILFLLVVAAVSISPVIFPDYSRELEQVIQENIQTFGVWGPIAMIVLLVLATIFSPIPNSLIIIAMGATYGLIGGTIIAIIGASLASSFAFFLARKFGEQLVERFFPKTHFLHRFLTNNAFPTIFILRLIPSVSFDMVSYGVGLTKIPFRTFFIASFLGTIPGIISYVLIGAGLTNDNSLSWAGVSLYGGLVILGFYLSHKMGLFSNGEKEEPAKKKRVKKWGKK
jgi:uncharacterized membrane protein YdjX (TVP38/TMEM64 family)